MNKDAWTTYQWAAYVEKGETKDSRNSRLKEVPRPMRPAVVRHVKTVFAIRTYHQRKAKEAGLA